MFESGQKGGREGREIERGEKKDSEKRTKETQGRTRTQRVNVPK